MSKLLEDLRTEQDHYEPFNFDASERCKRLADHIEEHELTRDEIKHIASEIVRGMGNYNLTKKQQDALEGVSDIVMTNYLMHKKELL